MIQTLSVPDALNANRGSRCHICTTYVRFKPSSVLPDPVEEFSKEEAPSQERGHLIQHTTGYHDCVWYRHWQCQMPQMQTGGAGVRVYTVLGCHQYNLQETVLACDPVSQHCRATKVWTVNNRLSFGFMWSHNPDNRGTAMYWYKLTS